MKGGKESLKSSEEGHLCSTQSTACISHTLFWLTCTFQRLTYFYSIFTDEEIKSQINSVAQGHCASNGRTRF